MPAPRRLLASMILALTLFGCSRPAPVVPLAPRPERLTNAARYEGEPDVSADGKRIVFSAFGEGDLDLFVMEAGRPAQAVLLHAGPGDDREPRWSPDGTKIVFTTMETGAGDIALIPAAGGEARRLTVEAADDRQPAWSPDGNRIAFVSDRSGRSELWIVTTATGTAVPISATDPPAPDYRLADPAWDGEGLIFSAAVNGEVDLWRIAPSGGVWTRVTSGPGRERHPNPARNGRIAFTSDSTGYARLSVRETDGRVTPITTDRTDVLSSSWLDDGSTLLYARVSPTALLAANLDGSGVDTVLAPWGKNSHPTWSPDGTELAYHAMVDGQDDIWRVTVADGGAGAVTSSLSDDTDPDWSKATGRIAFVSDRSGNRDIWLMDPTGVEFQNLSADPADDRDPRWTPDGSGVIFVSNRLGHDDLWLAPVAGGAAQRLTDDAAAEARPCILADGRTVLYEAARDGVRSIWSMAIEGGISTRVTTPPSPGGRDLFPAPIPGRPAEALFVRSIGGRRSIFHLTLGGAAPQTLITNPEEEDDAPAVSADGKRVAWQSGGNVDLWRIDARPVRAETEKS